MDDMCGITRLLVAPPARGAAAAAAAASADDAGRSLASACWCVASAGCECGSGPLVAMPQRCCGAAVWQPGMLLAAAASGCCRTCRACVVVVGGWHELACWHQQQAGVNAHALGGSTL
jgi:hypothetical protein